MLLKVFIMLRLNDATSFLLSFISSLIFSIKKLYPYKNSFFPAIFHTYKRREKGKEKVMVDMTLSILLAIITILLIIKAMLSQRDRPSHTKQSSYMKHSSYKKRAILTQGEKVFYNELKKACDKKMYIINVKTRLEDIIVSTTSDYRQKLSERGRIKSRHVDFAVLDKNLNLLFCIELDDSSHNTKEAKATDKFKNELFKKVNIPLYRVRVGTKFKKEIEKIFDDMNL